jgi:membrane associated rhomboid family serine protease
MGIYDREYYRREGPSFFGSFAERGTVCKWLIGINVACFILQILSRPAPTLFDPDQMEAWAKNPWGVFTGALVLDPQAVWHGEVWRLLTYAFLHDTNSLWHIAFNMLLLWWFGSEMEDLYGPREFLAFYLTAAVAGGVLYVLTPLVGLGTGGPALGASGAVTGVLVLSALHYPRRVIWLFFLLPVPIWLFVVFNVAQDAFALLSHKEGGVAVAGHLGGAAFGLAYYKLHWRLTGALPELRAWRRRRAQPRLRVYREEETPTPVSVAAAPPAPARPQAAMDDELLEAKVDAVLEKLSRVGKENLTDSERELLVRASERFKRRRR